MRDNPRASQAWPELPNDELVGDLNALYTAAEPPADLHASIHWALRERAADCQRTPTAKRKLDPSRWMPRRFATLAIAVIAVAVLVGASYASLPVLQEAFHINSGTDAIIANDLGKEVSISQTVEGFTMTVERVYADPNQIVIGYTLRGPEGRHFNHILAWGELGDGPAPMATSPFLTDTNGNRFHGGLAARGPAMQDGVAGGLLIYDGGDIPANAAEIDVQLTVGELSAYERLGDDLFQDVEVVGPMTFNLTIPVEPARAVALNQSVDVGGTTATLIRFVTTPTGTRVSLQGVGPSADVRLTVAGSTYQLHPEEGVASPIRWEPDSTWDYVSKMSLEDAQGELILTVEPGPAVVPPGIDPSATRLTGGPWEFRFVVP